MEKQKKHISLVTSEFKEYWENYFCNILPIDDDRFKENSKFAFYAKLCYKASATNTNNLKAGEEYISFFPTELNFGNDLFIECFDWNQEYYDKSNRILYRLRYDKEWNQKPEKYIKTLNKGLGSETYSVLLSDLELINKTPVKSNTPEPKKQDVNQDISILNSSEDLFDKTDENISQMTIRDKYCIEHNIPLSNKRWLNNLIRQGTQWNK